MRADGSGDRVVTLHAGFGNVYWSPDSRHVGVTPNPLQVRSPDGLLTALVNLDPVSAGINVQRADGTTIWSVPGGVDPVWSPSGRWLAYRAPDGLHAFAIRGDRGGLLVRGFTSHVAWAPDGGRLAYLDERNRIHTVTLKGRVAAVATLATGGGGAIQSLAWTRVAKGVRYRPPAKVDGHHAASRVTHLAADGSHTAFSTCSGISVWWPSTDAVVDGPIAGCSFTSFPLPVTGLAVAGNRVAYVTLGGGNTTIWSLGGFTTEPGVQRFTLASGNNTCCLWPPQVAGEGSLLVYATRKVVYRPDPMVEWELHGVGLAGCECPLLDVLGQSLQEPFQLDADAGRILIARRDSVDVVDADGSGLFGLSGLPADTGVNPIALEAALWEQDLYVRIGDTLRLYNINTGQLLHTFPLAGVPPSTRQPVLQDADRGLVAYALDGRIHVLHLSDGSEKVVGNGTLARFMDNGLVYADGARLHVAPISQLR